MSAWHLTSWGWFLGLRLLDQRLDPSCLVGRKSSIFQQGGHQFYVLSFPAQDKTWAYDISTQQWHQWAWRDGGGVLHRHRARQIFPAFINTQANILLAGDWQSGNIYLVDPTVYTDNGSPILRQRAFPHLLNDGNRRFYWQFIADIETGMAPGGATLNLD